MLYYYYSPGRVLSVAWSPDAKMIYSGSGDGYVCELLHV